MLSSHTFLLAVKRDVKKSIKICIKSSALTDNYCIVFDNVIVNFFHTTYSKIILKIPGGGATPYIRMIGMTIVFFRGLN